VANACQSDAFKRSGHNNRLLDIRNGSGIEHNSTSIVDNSASLWEPIKLMDGSKNIRWSLLGAVIGMLLPWPMYMALLYVVFYFGRVGFDLDHLSPCLAIADGIVFFCLYRKNRFLAVAYLIAAVISSIYCVRYFSNAFWHIGPPD